LNPSSRPKRELKRKLMNFNWPNKKPKLRQQSKRNSSRRPSKKLKSLRSRRSLPKRSLRSNSS
jgi:hypothetical protein